MTITNQHLTRLIVRFVSKKPLRQRKPPLAGFKRRYIEADISLLHKMDKLHDTPSGQAIKHLLKLAYTVFGDQAFERLSNISVSQIYNLRATDRYQDQRVQWRHTRPSKPVAIGVRKAPEPEGRAGFIRSAPFMESLTGCSGYSSPHNGVEPKSVNHVIVTNCKPCLRVVPFENGGPPRSRTEHQRIMSPLL